MQKITFLINSFTIGGAEKVLMFIINKLLEQNFEIEVICLEKNEFYKIDDKRVKKIFLSDFTGKGNRIKKFLYLPFLAWKLREYIKKNNIKLIQSHIHRANYVNILAKLLGGQHKVQIVSNGVLSRYLKDGIAGKVNLFFIKYLYPMADLIIWKSKGMLIDANKLFNFRNKQKVIYNPIDLKNISVLMNEKVSEFKFERDKIYLVSIGRLIKLKRNKDLIKALKYLDSTIEILFIGDGEEKENLISYVNKLNLKKRVHFIGKVSNPFKYLKKSDIFIHTSETEGFPNVLVEALACGLPVISTDCISGPREILAPESDINKQLKKGDDIEIAKYGILYPIGDIEKLAKAINLLLKDEKLFTYYKQKGLERAKDFSIEKIINEYKKVLLENGDKK